MLYAFMSFANVSTSVDLGKTTAPPANNAPSISYTDKSKLISETANILSQEFIPNLVLTAVIVFIADLLLITTPFGFPVLPEVYMTYASLPDVIAG